MRGRSVFGFQGTHGYNGNWFVQVKYGEYAEPLVNHEELETAVFVEITAGDSSTSNLGKSSNSDWYRGEVLGPRAVSFDTFHGWNSARNTAEFTITVRTTRGGVSTDTVYSDSVRDWQYWTDHPEDVVYSMVMEIFHPPAGSTPDAPTLHVGFLWNPVNDVSAGCFPGWIGPMAAACTGRNEIAEDMSCRGAVEGITKCVRHSNCLSFERKFQSGTKCHVSSSCTLPFSGHAADNWVGFFRDHDARRAAGCDVSMITYRGHCYKNSAFITTGFEDIRADCHAMGAEIASVRDKQENIVVLMNAVKGWSAGTSAQDREYALLLGYSDINNDGVFEYVDGTELDYTNWDSGERTPSSEDRLSIIGWGETDEWGFVPTDTNVGAAACKKKARPTGNCPPGALESPSRPGVCLMGTWSVGFVPFNHDSARSRCRELVDAWGVSRSARLATLVSAEEVDLAQTLVPNYDYEGATAWIGLVDPAGNGAFQWLDGSQMEAQFWADDQPATGSGACGVIGLHGWENTPCDDETLHTGAVCSFLSADAVAASPASPCEGGSMLDPSGTICVSYVSNSGTDAVGDARDICHNANLFPLSAADPYVATWAAAELIPDGDTAATLGLSDANLEGFWEWLDGTPAEDGEAAVWPWLGAAEPTDADGSLDCVIVDASSLTWQNVACDGVSATVGTLCYHSLACPEGFAWSPTGSRCLKVEKPADSLMSCSGNFTSAALRCAIDSAAVAAGPVAPVSAEEETLLRWLGESGEVGDSVDLHRPPAWVGVHDSYESNTFQISDGSSSPLDVVSTGEAPAFSSWDTDQPAPNGLLEPVCAYRPGLSVGLGAGDWHTEACSSEIVSTLDDPESLCGSCATDPVEDAPVQACPPRWRQNARGDRCYRVVRNPGSYGGTALDTDGLRQLCRSATDSVSGENLGAYAASVRDHRENGFAAALLPTGGASAALLGIRDHIQEGEYRWSDGTVEYLALDGSTSDEASFWADGEPATIGADDLDCVATDRQGRWTSVDCASTDLDGVVCAFDLGCPTGYALSPHLDRCVKTWSPTLRPHTFDEAAAHCRREGASMVSSRSHFENTWLSMLAESAGSMLLGLADTFDEGRWQWSDARTPVSFVNWDVSASEPSGSAAAGPAAVDEDCAYLDASTGLWNDAHCDRSLDSELGLQHVTACWKPSGQSFVPTLNDCADLKREYPSLPSGRYRSLSAGNPVYCDQEREGGGWTIVYAAESQVHGQDLLVSDVPRNGDPLSFEHYNTRRTFKASVASTATETLFQQITPSQYIILESPIFDDRLLRDHEFPYRTREKSSVEWSNARIRTSGEDGNFQRDFVDAGYATSDDLYPSGGDFGLAWSHQHGGFGYVSGRWFQASDCARTFIHSRGDGTYEAGWAVSQSFTSSWTANNQCSGNGGQLSFYIAMRNTAALTEAPATAEDPSPIVDLAGDRVWESCQELKDTYSWAVSGIYHLQPPGLSVAVDAYCDLDTDGGGWSIIHANDAADGAQPIVGDQTIEGNPLLLEPYSPPLAYKIAAAQGATETLFFRASDEWLIADAAAYDSRIRLSYRGRGDWPGVARSQSGETADILSGFVSSTTDGRDQYWSTVYGGDYGIVERSATFDLNLVEHHPLLSSSSCHANLLYSKSTATADWDAGYGSTVSLGSGWSAGGTCGSSEANEPMYVAMRGLGARTPTQRNGSYTSCLEAMLSSPDDAPSGLYDLSLPGLDGIQQIWCDQETDGGGWAVVYSSFDATDAELGNDGITSDRAVIGGNPFHLKNLYNLPLASKVALVGDDVASAETLAWRTPSEWVVADHGPWDAQLLTSENFEAYPVGLRGADGTEGPGWIGWSTRFTSEGGDFGLLSGTRGFDFVSDKSYMRNAMCRDHLIYSSSSSTESAAYRAGVAFGDAWSTTTEGGSCVGAADSDMNGDLGFYLAVRTRRPGSWLPLLVRTSYGGSAANAVSVQLASAVALSKVRARPIAGYWDCGDSAVERNSSYVWDACAAGGLSAPSFSWELMLGSGGAGDKYVLASSSRDGLPDGCIAAGGDGTAGDIVCDLPEDSSLRSGGVADGDMLTSTNYDLSHGTVAPDAEGSIVHAVDGYAPAACAALSHPPRGALDCHRHSATRARWVKLLHHAQYGGGPGEQYATRPMVSGVSVQSIKVVWVDGFVSCDDSADTTRPWLACDDTNFAFELFVDDMPVAAMPDASTLPAECAEPSTGSGDIVCELAAPVEIGEYSTLMPTWYGASNNVDGGSGVITVDVFAYVDAVDPESLSNEWELMLANVPLERASTDAGALPLVSGTLSGIKAVWKGGAVPCPNATIAPDMTSVWNMCANQSSLFGGEPAISFGLASSDDSVSLDQPDGRWWSAPDGCTMSGDARRGDIVCDVNAAVADDTRLWATAAVNNVGVNATAGTLRVDIYGRFSRPSRTGRWIKILAGFQYGGFASAPAAIDHAIATPARISRLRAVHVEGGVACSGATANESKPWQACSDAEGVDQFSFELLRSHTQRGSVEYVLKQPSEGLLPPGCCPPLASDGGASGSVECMVDVTLYPDDLLQPSWFAESRFQNRSGVHTIDLWAYVTDENEPSENVRMSAQIGDSCEATCNEGYTLVGSQSRTCQDGGAWSGTRPVCALLAPFEVASVENRPIHLWDFENPVNGLQSLDVFGHNHLEGYSHVLGNEDGDYTASSASTRSVYGTETFSGFRDGIGCIGGTCGRLATCDAHFRSQHAYDFDSIGARRPMSLAAWVALGFHAVGTRVPVLSVGAPENAGSGDAPVDACCGSSVYLAVDVSSYLGGVCHEGCGDLSASRVPEVGRGASIRVAEWTHVALSFDGSVTRVYINGTEAQLAGKAGSLMPHLLGAARDERRNRFYVGADSVSGGSRSMACDAAVDELRVYDYAVSPEQAAQLAALIQCPVLSNPKFGAVDCTGNRPGDVCVVSCEARYFRHPTVRRRVCQADGTWSGAPAACARIAPFEAGYSQEQIDKRPLHHWDFDHIHPSDDIVGPRGLQSEWVDYWQGQRRVFVVDDLIGASRTNGVDGPVLRNPLVARSLRGAEDHDLAMPWGEAAGASFFVPRDEIHGTRPPMDSLWEFDDVLMGGAAKSATAWVWQEPDDARSSGRNDCMFFNFGGAPMDRDCNLGGHAADFGFGTYDGSAGSHRLSFTGCATVIEGTEDYVFGTWKHVAVVQDGIPSEDAHLYIDGVRVNTANSRRDVRKREAQDRSSFMNGFQVGLDTHWAGQSARAANFRLHALAVYNRALSADEVFQLYSTTGGGLGPTTSVLAGMWPGSPQIEVSADEACRWAGGVSNTSTSVTFTRQRRGADECTCLAPFRGKHCEEVDYCSALGCAYGGVATQIGDACVCDCPLGTSGPHCEVNEDDCADSPCQGGALCVDGVNDFHCECSSPLHGGRTCDRCLDPHVFGYPDCNVTWVAAEASTVDSERFDSANDAGLSRNVSNCYKHNWYDVMSGADGSISCDDGYMVTRLYRATSSGDGSLEHLEEAYCCPMPEQWSQDDIECSEIDTTSLFNENNWAECEPGWFFHGLTKGSGSTLGAINALECCHAKPTAESALSDSWGHCYEPSTFPTCFNSENDCGCDDGYFMVGIKREGGSALSDLERVKCCEMTYNDNCGASPCNGHGTCSPGQGTDYTCDCDLGYSGDDCENVVDVCSSEVNRCNEKGSCLADENGYWHCVDCAESWSGEFCHLDVDECSTTTCYNGGECVDGDNTFACSCRDGYAGRHCEVESATGPCLNSGRLGGCVCYEPFTGDLCDEYDPCSGFGCANGGIPTASEDSCACACPAGFEGDHCETNADDCAGVICPGYSVCVDGINEYSCVCTNDLHIGKGCDACASNKFNFPSCTDEYDSGLLGEITAEWSTGIPAVEDGLCYKSDWVTPLDANFGSDECAPGFALRAFYRSGDFPGWVNNIEEGWCCPLPAAWEEDEIECTMVPIASMFSNSGDSAWCPAGWVLSGLQRGSDNTIVQLSFKCCRGIPGVAENALNSTWGTCLSSPNFHACFDNVNSCGCPDDMFMAGMTRSGGTGLGYIEELHCCEVLPADPCTPDYCNGQGTCIQGDATLTCDCHPGYSGEFCEINDDECAEFAEACNSHGFCSDGVASWTCANCAEGWSGEFCHVNVQDCQDVHCLHGGSCVEGDNSWACECPYGFGGRYCEIENYYGSCKHAEPILQPETCDQHAVTELDVSQATLSLQAGTHSTHILQAIATVTGEFSCVGAACPVIKASLTDMSGASVAGRPHTIELPFEPDRASGDRTVVVSCVFDVPDGVTSIGSVTVSWAPTGRNAAFSEGSVTFTSVEIRPNGATEMGGAVAGTGHLYAAEEHQVERLLQCRPLVDEVAAGDTIADTGAAADSMDPCASLATGASRAQAARSCHDAAVAQRACGAIYIEDGSYWIGDPAADIASDLPRLRHCDQTTAGGGWTFVNEYGRSTVDAQDVRAELAGGLSLFKYDTGGLVDGFSEVLVRRQTAEWCDAFGEPHDGVAREHIAQSAQGISVDAETFHYYSGEACSEIETQGGVLCPNEDSELAGGCWKIVRRSDDSGTWHSADDNLRGTAVYGVPGPKDEPGSPEWSISFDPDEVDEFLFATGDEDLWMVVDATEVWAYHHYGDGVFIPEVYRSGKITQSHTSAESYRIGWRQPGYSSANQDPAAPIISFDELSTSTTLYQEGGSSGGELCQSHNGCNVFVRSRSDVEAQSTHRICTEGRYGPLAADATLRGSAEAGSASQCTSNVECLDPAAEGAVRNGAVRARSVVPDGSAAIWNVGGVDGSERHHTLLLGTPHSWMGALTGCVFGLPSTHSQKLEVYVRGGGSPPKLPGSSGELVSKFAPVNTLPATRSVETSIGACLHPDAVDPFLDDNWPMFRREAPFDLVPYQEFARTRCLQSGVISTLETLVVLRELPLGLSFSSFSASPLVSRPPASCGELRDAGFTTSGWYSIYPGSDSQDGREAAVAVTQPPVTVFCDQDTVGGGWTVITAEQGPLGTSELAGCEDRWMYNPVIGMCVRYFAVLRDYAGAQQFCSGHDATLHMPKTWEEAIPTAILPAPVQELEYLGIWVGADDLEVEGQYKWLDGAELDPTSDFWRSDEPNNHGGAEDCVHLTYFNGGLNDLACSRDLYVACQKDPSERSEFAAHSYVPGVQPLLDDSEEALVLHRDGDMIPAAGAANQAVVLAMPGDWRAAHPASFEAVDVEARVTFPGEHFPSLLTLRYGWASHAGGCAAAWSSGLPSGRICLFDRAHPETSPPMIAADWSVPGDSSGGLCGGTVPCSAGERQLTIAVRGSRTLAESRAVDAAAAHEAPMPQPAPPTFDDEELPANCVDALERDPDVADGLFWVRSTSLSTPQRVWCDMTNGGWQLCATAATDGTGGRSAASLLFEDSAVAATEQAGYSLDCSALLRRGAAVSIAPAASNFTEVSPRGADPVLHSAVLTSEVIHVGGAMRWTADGRANVTVVGGDGSEADSRHIGRIAAFVVPQSHSPACAAASAAFFELDGPVADEELACDSNPNRYAGANACGDVCTGGDGLLGASVFTGSGLAYWVKPPAVARAGLPLPRTCSDVKARMGDAARDGPTALYPAGADGPVILGECDQTTDGGGWTLLFDLDAIAVQRHELNLDYSQARRTLASTATEALIAFRQADATLSGQSPLWASMPMPPSWRGSHPARVAEADDLSGWPVKLSSDAEDAGRTSRTVRYGFGRFEDSATDLCGADWGPAGPHGGRVCVTGADTESSLLWAGFSSGTTAVSEGLLHSSCRRADDLSTLGGHDSCTQQRTFALSVRHLITPANADAAPAQTCAQLLRQRGGQLTAAHSDGGEQVLLAPDGDGSRLRLATCYFGNITVGGGWTLVAHHNPADSIADAGDSLDYMAGMHGIVRRSQQVMIGFTDENAIVDEDSVATFVRFDMPPSWKLAHPMRFWGPKEDTTVLAFAATDDSRESGGAFGTAALLRYGRAGFDEETGCAGDWVVPLQGGVQTPRGRVCLSAAALPDSLDTGSSRNSGALTDDELPLWANLHAGSSGNARPQQCSAASAEVLNDPDVNGCAAQNRWFTILVRDEPASSFAASAVPKLHRSCLEILHDDPAAESGFTTVYPTGSVDAPVLVHCDQERAGGGWTRVWAQDPSVDLATAELAYADGLAPLASAAASVLLGYRNTAGETTSPWVVAPMPVRWRDKHPGAYSAEQDEVSVMLEDGTMSGGLLIYGNGAFADTCMDEWDTSAGHLRRRKGRICVKLSTHLPDLGEAMGAYKTPSFMGFATHQMSGGDRCVTDFEYASDGQGCSADRFFTLYVREGEPRLPSTCLEIADRDAAAETGRYVIYPSRTLTSAMEVTCDFDVDGGGWTVVYSAPDESNSALHAPVYDSGLEHVLAASTETLVAFRDEVDSFVVSGSRDSAAGRDGVWAYFSTPHSWKSQHFGQHNDEVFEDVSVHLPHGVTTTTVRAGRGKLDGDVASTDVTCSTPFSDENDGALGGLFCIVGTDAPLWTGWASADVADACLLSRDDARTSSVAEQQRRSSAFSCGKRRRFTIAMRERRPDRTESVVPGAGAPQSCADVQSQGGATTAVYPLFPPRRPGPVRNPPIPDADALWWLPQRLRGDASGQALPVPRGGYPSSCLDVLSRDPNAADGVYRIHPPRAHAPFDTYCDMRNGGFMLCGSADGNDAASLSAELVVEHLIDGADTVSRTTHGWTRDCRWALHRGALVGVSTSPDFAGSDLDRALLTTDAVHQDGFMRWAAAGITTSLAVPSLAEFRVKVGETSECYGSNYIGPSLRVAATDSNFICMGHAGALDYAGVGTCECGVSDTGAFHGRIHDGMLHYWVREPTAIDDSIDGADAPVNVLCDFDTPGGPWDVLLSQDGNTIADGTAASQSAALYVRGSEAIAATASDALIAVKEGADPELVVSVRFPVPPEWRRKSPAAFDGGTDVTDWPVVRPGVAAPVLGTVRFGRQSAETGGCDLSWADGGISTGGRICVGALGDDLPVAPYLGGFADESDLLCGSHSAGCAVAERTAYVGLRSPRREPECTPVVVPATSAAARSCSEILSARVPWQASFCVSTLLGPRQLRCAQWGESAWTLVAETSLGSTTDTNLHSSFLLTGEIAAANLADSAVAHGALASVDARKHAVELAHQVMLSDPSRLQTVEWLMHAGRTVETWWNHGAGQATIAAATSSAVTVTSRTAYGADGRAGTVPEDASVSGASGMGFRSDTCYQNEYGVLPGASLGGSFPGTWLSAAGDETAANDMCMAIGAIEETSVDVHGFEPGADGFDAPTGGADWAVDMGNAATGSPAQVSIWLNELPRHCADVWARWRAPQAPLADADVREVRLGAPVELEPNVPGAAADWVCPDGTVLVGFGTSYSTASSDRVYSWRCRELMVDGELEPPLDFSQKRAIHADYDGSGGDREYSDMYAPQSTPYTYWSAHEADAWAVRTDLGGSSMITRIVTGASAHLSGAWDRYFHVYPSRDDRLRLTTCNWYQTAHEGSAYAVPVEFTCPSDTVARNLLSKRSGSDRRWFFECCRVEFVGKPAVQETGVYVPPRVPLQDADHDMTCPVGSAVTGMTSRHTGDAREDRDYGVTCTAFRLREVEASDGTDGGEGGMRPLWTDGYARQNYYDTSWRTTIHTAAQGNWVITRVVAPYQSHSSHDDRKLAIYWREDPRVELVDCHWSGTANAGDGPQAFFCSAGEVMRNIVSRYDNDFRDRVESFECCTMVQATDPPNAPADGAYMQDPDGPTGPLEPFTSTCSNGWNLVRISDSSGEAERFAYEGGYNFPEGLDSAMMDGTAMLPAAVIDEVLDPEHSLWMAQHYQQPREDDNRVLWRGLDYYHLANEETFGRRALTSIFHGKLRWNEGPWLLWADVKWMDNAMCFEQITEGFTLLEAQQPASGMGFICASGGSRGMYLENQVSREGLPNYAGGPILQKSTTWVLVDPRMVPGVVVPPQAPVDDRTITPDDV